MEKRKKKAKKLLGCLAVMKRVLIDVIYFIGGGPRELYKKIFIIF